MSSKLLNHLQSGAAGDFGKNLLMPPSRIVPLSFQDMYDLDEPRDCEPEKVETITYLAPNQEEVSIICKAGSTICEPSAYFLEPHSFIQSVLYLTTPEFYAILAHPRKKDTYLCRFIQNMLEKYKGRAPKKEVRSVKKLMQHLLSIEWNSRDTDPAFNPFFAIFVSALEDLIEGKIAIVHTDERGYFRSITPSTVPSLGIDETEQRYLLLGQLPNGRFAPYGICFA
jgi:hypothetical protein